MIGDLGLHRAVLGPTHRAKLRLLVDVSWQGFVVVFAGPLRVDRGLKQLVPIEGIPSPAELFIAITGTRSMTGNKGWLEKRFTEI